MVLSSVTNQDEHTKSCRPSYGVVGDDSVNQYCVITTRDLTANVVQLLVER